MMNAQVIRAARRPAALLPGMSFAVAAMLCLPATAHAQSAAASSTAPAGVTAASAPVRIQLAPGMRVARVHAASASAAETSAGTVSLPAGTISQSAQTGSLAAPPFGLDYTHQAVRQRFDAQRALIDPVTQHRLALERRIRRETPATSVLPVFFPAVPVIIIQQSPPPVIVVEQTSDRGSGVTLAAGPAAPRHLERTPDEPAPAAESPAPPAPPLPDLEAMVLVRRDGEKILVVAYSRRSDHVMYITRDGRRRTLALADFDPEATRLANL